jgi:hypothetical protein
MEHIRPSVLLPDGTTVYPTGKMWLLGYALVGCEWAKEELTKLLSETCEHKFVYLDTSKWEDYSGSYNTKFVRVDRFFCERCLKEQENKREEYSRETPDWYK